MVFLQDFAWRSWLLESGEEIRVIGRTVVQKQNHEVTVERARLRFTCRALAYFCLNWINQPTNPSEIWYWPEVFRALGPAYVEQTCSENCNSRLLSTWRDVWSACSLQTWREMGLVGLTLWTVESRRWLVYLLGRDLFGEALAQKGFSFVSLFWGLGWGFWGDFFFFFFFSLFPICPKTPDQTDFQEVATFCFKTCSCFSDEKFRKVFGQDPR